MPLKARIWMTFEAPSFSPIAFWYAQFSLVIITVSTLTFCLETEINCEPFSVESHSFVTADNCGVWEETWKFAEIAAIVCFTTELTLRFFSCPSKARFLRGVMNWVDLIAILPFFVELALAASNPGVTSSTNSESGSGAESTGALEAFSVFRVVRLVRVFRVFKVSVLLPARAAHMLNPQNLSPSTAMTHQEWPPLAFHRARDACVLPAC